MGPVCHPISPPQRKNNGKLLMQIGLSNVASGPREGRVCGPAGPDPGVPASGRRQKWDWPAGRRGGVGQPPGGRGAPWRTAVEEGLMALLRCQATINYLWPGSLSIPLVNGLKWVECVPSRTSRSSEPGSPVTG